jgi:hypothetical protein
MHRGKRAMDHNLRERCARTCGKTRFRRARGLCLKKIMTAANYDKIPSADVCKVHVGPCEASSDLRVLAV